MSKLKVSIIEDLDGGAPDNLVQKSGDTMTGTLTNLVGLIIDPTTFTSDVGGTQEPIIETNTNNDPQKGYLYLNPTDGTGATGFRLLVQWGVETGGNGPVFPIPYPSAPWGTVCTSSDGNDGRLICTIRSITKTRINTNQKNLDTTPGNLGHTYTWLAIGRV